LAGGGRKLTQVMKSAPVGSGATYSDWLQAHRAIGTLDNSTFPLFASLSNTWYKGELTSQSSVTCTYLTQKRCPHERRIGLKAILVHMMQE
jgi:hypothetical protein